MRTAYLLGAIGLITGTALGYGVALKTMSSTEPSLVNSSPSFDAKNTTITPRAPATLDVTPNESAPLTTADTVVMSTDNTVNSPVDLNNPALFQVRDASFSDIYTLIQYVADRDFSELEQLAAQITGVSDQTVWEHEEALHLIMSRMVELDQDQTLAFIAQRYTQDRSGRNNHWFASAIVTLAQSRVDEMMAWADSLPSKQQRRELLSVILRGYAQVEPRQALELYQQQNFGFGQEYPYDILHTWAQNDPEEAVDWVMSQSDFNINSGALQSVFSSWVYTDPASASAYLNTIGDVQVRSELEVMVLDGLAQQNPQAALEQALVLTEQHRRFAGMQSALMSWGASAPLEAIEYARDYLSGQEQEMAYQILASTVHMNDYGLSGSGPLETLQQSENFPAPIRQAVRQSTIGLFFDEDPTAALAWIDAVADENERSQLLASVAWLLPAYDLQLAQTMYEQASGEVRSALAGGIAQQLVETDLEQAMQWYEQQPNGEMREQMRYMMANRLAHTDPMQALSMFDATDESNESGMLMSVFVQVLMSNRVAAEQWLQQANVSESVRTELNQIMIDMSTQQYYMYGVEGAASEFDPLLEY